MFDSPVPDEELPDALDVAQRLCEAPWDDLVDEVKLTFVTRAQRYIDVIAPPLIRQRDQARGMAVELEQRQLSRDEAGACIEALARLDGRVRDNARAKLTATFENTTPEQEVQP